MEYVNSIYEYFHERKMPMFTQKDLQGMEQLRRVMQLYAGTLPEERAREVAAVYPRWTPGAVYGQGQYLTDGQDENGDPVLYRVVQGHTSQADWPPAKSPALYTCLSLDPGGYPVWSPPTGAQDAYNTGDTVSHKGALWRSRIDGNTTEPGSDDRWWEKVSKSDT